MQIFTKELKNWHLEMSRLCEKVFREQGRNAYYQLLLRIEKIFSCNTTVKSSVIGILSTCWLTLLDTSVWVPCAHITQHPQGGIIPALHIRGATHVFQKKSQCAHITQHPQGGIIQALHIRGAIHVLQKKLRCCIDQEQVCDQTPTVF